MSVNVEIEARSIFRILAIQKIVDDKNFASKLNGKDENGKDVFDNILEEIEPTPRIADTDKKFPDYLNYSKPHDGAKEGRIDFENIGEERLCRAEEGFFGIIDDEVMGTVIDYQVPLTSSNDVGEGVIDLISVKENKAVKENNEIYIIEAKKWDSPEHPIRAMFEALTFWKMVGGKDCRGFISRYNESKTNRFKKLPDGAKAYPAILIREMSDHEIRDPKKHGIYKSMMGNGLSGSPYIGLYKKILESCDLRCFSYTKNDKGKIEIQDFTKKFKDEIVLAEKE